MTAARLIVIILSLAFSCPVTWANEQAAGSGKFAKSIDIQLEPGHPFYKIEFGESVYRNLATRDLREVQIFDSLNQSLPLAILPTPRSEIVKTTIKRSLLPFYPIYAQSAKDLDNLAIHVNRNPQGSIVDIRLNNGSGDAAKKNLVAYLFDATTFRKPVTKFDLSWNLASQDTPIVRLKLEYSDDLANWKTLDVDNVLALMTHQGRVLAKAGVQGGDTQANYFRVSWPDSDNGIVVTRVAAAYVQSEGREPEFKWTRIAGTPDPDKPNTFLYNTGGYFPVQRARVKLPQGIFNASVSLASTPDIKISPDKLHRNRHLSDLVDPRRAFRTNGTRSREPYWQNRSSHSPVFDIDLNGIRFKSDDLKFSRTVDQYWRMELASNASQYPEAPVLEIGWVPDTAIFPAAGKPPYRLMVGNEKALRRNLSNDQLVSQMKSRQLQPAPATLVETGEPPAVVTDTGGKFSKDSTLNWILWAVMCLGVLMLAWMAYRLVSQMNESENSD